MTTTALAVSKPQLTPDAFQMITQVAPVMHAARLFGTKTPEQAMAIMIKGYELGFSLTAAFENIHVIEDKPSLSPKGALAMIYNSPLNDGVTIVDEVDASGKPLACVVTMKRKGGLTYTTRYSMEDAKRAGLVKEKSGWEKYPANMLRWRAIGYCADVVFPDVIGGTKRADEFGADLTPDGDVIEGSWNNVGSQPSPQPAPAVTVSQTQQVSSNGALTVQDLLKTYTAAQIMTANNGRIPATVEECQRVVETLGGLDE